MNLKEIDAINTLHAVIVGNGPDAHFIGHMMSIDVGQRINDHDLDKLVRLLIKYEIDEEILR
jgi:hypothetical protein